VVVEIVRHTNVGYLDPESGMNSAQIDYKFTPQFASGALFASSFLDTLVCQAFYNTKIIEVVNKLIGSVDNKDLDKKGAKSTLLGSSLYQIGIPDGLESKTYGALYKLLSNRKQIPLGILRGVFPHTKSGPKANKMPYVFTNPPKDTELFSCDKIFVLSQTPIKIGKVAKVRLNNHLYCQFSSAYVLSLSFRTTRRRCTSTTASARRRRRPRTSSPWSTCCATRCRPLKARTPQSTRASQQ
jgi:hypothetical protein